MVRIIFLATLLVKANTWLLKSTHSSIIPDMTNDVRLNCSQAGKEQGMKSNFDPTRLQIQKQIDGDTWSTYATLDKSNIRTPHTDMPGIVVTGYLGKENETYLSVTWLKAHQDTVGSYICKVDGKDAESGNSVKDIMTKTVNITKNDKPSMSQLVNGIVSLKNKMNVADRMIQKHLIGMENNLPQVRYWPTGKYNLLSPKTGCPGTRYSNLHGGYYRVQSSTKYKYNFSFPVHIHPDAYVRKFHTNIIHFQFCRHPNTATFPIKTVLWPKGDYCIGMYSMPKDCLDLGFKFKSIIVELSIPAHAYIALTSKGTAIEWTARELSYSFCCRDDGSVEEPILLPDNKPFYLYRIRKECQSVADMDVTKEHFNLEGMPIILPSKSYEMTANSKLVPVYLCYYSPKKDVK